MGFGKGFSQSSLMMKVSKIIPELRRLFWCPVHFVVDSTREELLSLCRCVKCCGKCYRRDKGIFVG